MNRKILTQATTALTGSERSYSVETREVFFAGVVFFPAFCASDFFLEPETAFSARLFFCFSAMKVLLKPRDSK